MISLRFKQETINEESFADANPEEYLRQMQIEPISVAG